MQSHTEIEKLMPTTALKTVLNNKHDKYNHTEMDTNQIWFIETIWNWVCIQTSVYSAA